MEIQLLEISPFNEYSGFISFRIDWFNLLALQKTPTPLFESNNCVVFNLLYGPSYLYMTTGKIIAFTIQNFVSKVMSLLFNMLSRFFIAFLPKSKLLFPFQDFFFDVDHF